MSPVTSSMAGETDINTKYQKLATEYAKLRSQVRLVIMITKKIFKKNHLWIKDFAKFCIRFFFQFSIRKEKSYRDNTILPLIP